MERIFQRSTKEDMEKDKMEDVHINSHRSTRVHI